MTSPTDRASGSYFTPAGYQAVDFSARERDKLWLNGPSGFVDASYLGGVDSPQDGRVVAEADLDHDGVVELIVAYRNAPILRIFRASGLARGNVLAVDVGGTPRNRSAVGAVVTARCGKTLHTQLVQVGTGFSTQNARALPLGLGDCPRVSQLTVTWPDGQQRKFLDVASDALYRVSHEGALEEVPGYFQRRAAPAVAGAPAAAAPSLTEAVAAAPAYRGGNKAPWQPSKPLLYVTFWATWCEACKNAQPSLDALAARYGARVDFVGVSLDPEDEGKVGAYEAKAKPGYPLLEVDAARRAAIEAAVSPLFHGDPPYPSGVLVDRSSGRVLLKQSGVPTVSQMEIALAPGR